MNKDYTAEEKIILAAKSVFHTKGYEGCSSREIAKAAGLNVALVNYYFRSKNQLFQLVFKSALNDFVLSMIEVFKADLTLEEKLTIFVEKEYDFLSKHPELPNFIINELNRGEGCLDQSEHFEKIKATGIFSEFQQAQDKGEMIDINLTSVILLILSNCQYPVMSKKFMQSIIEITNENYDILLKQHKEHVIKMLVTYLFPKNNKSEI
jgi:AcrR family transcriptional regulator